MHMYMCSSMDLALRRASQGGPSIQVRQNLLQLLPERPASSALSWASLWGFRQQLYITYTKMRLRCCAHLAAAEHVPEMLER